MVDMKKTTIVVACLALAASLFAATGARPAGSGLSGVSPYATDAYPGFDGLDDIPKAERREKSWFFGVKRETPAEQYAYAKELEAAGEYKDAVKMCDALVREWPASLEAPQAQMRLAMIQAKRLEAWEDAFESLEYLLNFYSKDCPYLELVEYEYKLVNLMVKERKSFLGFSFLSDRLVRQRYESIVRRAPGADYVPEVMLKIAALRESDDHYEEAIQVYGQLANKFPGRSEARTAAYLEAKARMWLCRRLAYNLPRCLDTLNYLKMTLRRIPDLAEADELRGWQDELAAHMGEEAFLRAKFYDTKQRTRHAAIASWERFIRENPQSLHLEEAKARLAELRAADETANSTTH